MNDKLLKLAERRGALVAQAAAQRETLGAAFEPWRKPLAIADRGVLAMRFIARHKLLAAGAAAFAVALRPNLALEILRKGWLIWRFALAVKRKLAPW